MRGRLVGALLSLTGLSLRAGVVGRAQAYARSSSCCGLRATPPTSRAHIDMPPTFAFISPRLDLNSFHGTEPEPREGLSSGHMPHSLSLPFQSVLTPESSTTPPYRTMLSPDELEKVFEGVMGREMWQEVKSGKRGIVSTCGSGMTVSWAWLGSVVPPRCSRRLGCTYMLLTCIDPHLNFPCS